MEFSVFCPHDGRVEVGLEHIANVILQDAECVDIVMICPVCGEEIRIQLRIPNLLVTAMELVELAEGRDTVAPAEGFAVSRGCADTTAEMEVPTEAPAAQAVEVKAPPVTNVDERRIEGYCEYFRRQLADIDSVEAMLSEMDGSAGNN